MTGAQEMKRSRIIGIGSYLPERVVTNFDLTQMMDTSDEWIVQRSGIRERHWAAPNETTSDLARVAAERAIANAGISKTDLDMIILATLSPDHEFPGTGCFLQAKLGVTEIPALDIRQQCSGFIYGLSIADQYIRSGMYQNILVVGAELHSRGLDKTTRGRDVSVLFGDGSGAALLSACEVQDPDKDPHIYSTHLHADGRFGPELWVYAPGCDTNHPTERITAEMLEKGLHYPQMNGKKVFTWAVRKMGEVVVESLEKNRMPRESVDLFFFHQANLRINEAVAQQLQLPWDKVYNTIDRFGNTTAATIPIGMDDAIKTGRLQKGMRVALAAFGSGFTWSSALLRL